VEQPIVDSARGMGDQAEKGAGAEEGREKREQEIKAKFGGVAKSLSARRDFQVRWTTRRTGMPLQVPEGFQRKTGNNVPNAHLARIGGGGIPRIMIGAEDDRCLGLQYLLLEPLQWMRISIP